MTVNANTTAGPALASPPLVRSSDLDTSPIEFTVAGMIPRTGHGYVWGPPGAGKSLAFGFELALAVANGTPFFGRETRPGPVIYALGEGLAGSGVRKQARLARQVADDVATVAAGGTPVPYTDENLFVLAGSFDACLTRAGAPSRSMTEAMARIAALGETPEICIIDAAQDFSPTSSLSNDSTASRFAAGLKYLADALNTFVLVIAHPTSAGRMAGGQRLRNAAHTVIEVAPDDVAAPGAAHTATVTCRKSKDGLPFADFGYQILPCEWDEPAYGDDGELTGETVTVTSATVRMLAAPDLHAAPGRAPAAVPELAAAPAAPPAKRSGLRPRLHSVPNLADARARRAMVPAILGPQCPEDGCRRPGGMGCDLRVKGSGLMALSMDPPVGAHADRILAAALAQPDPEGFMDAVLAMAAGMAAA